MGGEGWQPETIYVYIYIYVYVLKKCIKNINQQPLL